MIVGRYPNCIMISKTSQVFTVSLNIRKSFSLSSSLFESRKENLQEKLGKKRKRNTFASRYSDQKAKDGILIESLCVCVCVCNVRNKAKRQSDF